MTIRTFYRPDSSMLNMLINTVEYASGNGFEVVDGHRFIATVKKTATTDAFAKLHPGETEILTVTHWFGDEQFYLIGVSFSQLTKEVFERLAQQRTSNIGHFVRILNELTDAWHPTSVADLYTDGKHQYGWYVPGMYTGNELTFVQLLNGFDFHYEYTDDSSVYNKWNNKWKDIKKQGDALFIAEDRMNEIYRQLANR